MINIDALEKLINAGYDNVPVIYLTNYSYDDALIGISEDNRAVYDYNKMIIWLMQHEGFNLNDAVEWIDYNTIRALPYMGESRPIIMYPIE